MLSQTIDDWNDSLKLHPLYTKLTSVEAMRIFMKYHVFAVWDFMSLLKSLQVKLTSVSVPWIESPYSTKIVRLINEIVLGEESDFDHNGEVQSHFSLYLNSMREIGADTQPIEKFLQSLDFNDCPEGIRNIVGFHLDLAQTGQVHEVAASFFYGREKPIPQMFQSIVNVLRRENLNCETLIYYFERHILVDSQEHGPMAKACLDELLTNQTLKEEAEQIAILSLRKRNELWNFIAQQIDLEVKTLSNNLHC